MSTQKCKPGQIRIKRKAYYRKAYTRKDGVHVKATFVPASTYCIRDVGTAGRKSRVGKNRWIKCKGKLGGAGYLSKSAADRQKLIRACIKAYGYRSCLGSILVLERNTVVRKKYGVKLAADRAYVKKKFGGPGSFGKRGKKEPKCIR